jgi:hypothetical protein
VAGTVNLLIRRARRRNPREKPGKPRTSWKMGSPGRRQRSTISCRTRGLTSGRSAVSLSGPTIRQPLTPRAGSPIRSRQCSSGIQLREASRVANCSSRRCSVGWKAPVSIHETLGPVDLASCLGKAQFNKAGAMGCNLAVFRSVCCNQEVPACDIRQ